MVVTTIFLVALLFVSLITSIVIGLGVQWAASEWQLGPLPRAFIGFSIIIPTIILKTFELGIIRLFPVILAIYYIGVFQIGTKIGQAVGMKAPNENDPPDFFFDMINRYD